MPIYRLGPDPIFPPPEHAEPSGLLAVGGDLSPDRLIQAYAHGIFPWYSEGEPILWHSPDPRMILIPSELKLQRSLRQAAKKRPYTITFDTAFREVIAACGEISRPDQDGTWITDEMLDAYCKLHEMGIAHSAEAWEDGELVGGLYGISIGSLFCGESMFSYASDASKIAFAKTIRQLQRWNFTLIDCQVYTDHLARFGAKEHPREVFLDLLEDAVQQPTRLQPWVLDEDLRNGAIPAS